MKPAPLALAVLGALCPLIGPCAGGVVSATLNLVNEGGVNDLAISLAIPTFETGNATSSLSGTVNASLAIDPATGVVTQLTFTGGTITGSPINLSGNSTQPINPGSYTLTSNPLTGRLNTLAPPAAVDNAPGAGDFAANLHELLINGGVLSGSISTLFVNENVNQDFAASPVAVRGSGIGNIATTFRADLSSQTVSVFDLVVFVGLGSSSEVEAGGTTVVFGASGTIKLAGQVSVPYLPLIFNFSPNPQIVANGGTLGLDYNVAGADTLSIDQGVGAVNPANLGTRVVTPPGSSDLTYTLTASNENGSVTRTTVVRAVAPGSATARYVRFTPVRLKSDLPGFPAANSVQIADFQFFEGPTERDPVGVTNPGGDNPGGEGPENLLDDNSATKWLDFNKGGVIFDFGSAVTIDRYRFRTGNDAEERDPVAWLLEASDDQDRWTVIEGISVRQDDPGVDFNHFTPFAREAFAQKIPIPAVPTLPPAIITSFGATPQIQVDGSATTLSWDTVSAAHLEIDNGIGPVSGASDERIVTPPPNTDTKYTLTADNGIGQLVQATTCVRSVIAGSATHRYIRFTPLRLAEDLPGMGSANSVQLSEFEFFNGVAPVLPLGVTNPGGDNPPGEEPANLLDGSSATKWLDFNKGALVFDFGSGKTVTHYRWRTANDEPPRDPIAWVLEGSDNGSSWTLVDSADRNRSAPGEKLAFHAGLPRATATPLVPVPDAASLLPVIKQFVGDAPFLVSGEPLVLTWDTSGAAEVSLDHGIGAVAASGAIVLTPAADTTFTLTATTAAGSVTKEFQTTIVSPDLARICYENFDSAGDELALLGDAAILDDFGRVPLPGDADRLRLTPDSGGRSGTAWFRRRMDLSQGFQTVFDLHLLAGRNSGGDGLAFIIQNTPEGTGAEPGNRNEDGLPRQAFNVGFDSYFNPDGEPSAAFLQVIDGSRVLRVVDLTTTTGIALPGTVPDDLSSDDFEVAPYAVRIAYVPGDLDVWFEGVLVIDSLAVDLASTGALDEDGKGYVGFSARTGAFSENHDVTRWILTEGPPAPPLVLTDLAVDLATDTARFSFASSPFRSYRIEESIDGITFTTLASGIPGATGAAETTTAPIGFVETPVKIFRVVDEKP